MRKPLTKAESRIIDNLGEYRNTNQFIYRLGALSALKELAKRAPQTYTLTLFNSYVSKISHI